MKYENPTFATADRSSSQRRRFVVSIEFDSGSLYFASHSDTTGIPGIVFQGVLQQSSAKSQRLVPDDSVSDIGSMSFRIVDKAGTVTDAFRTKLTALKGLRGKTVRFYRGFEGFVWSAFSLFQTQIIKDAEFDFGAYVIECSDITREQRKQVFEPKTTTLRLSCTATDTTIAVYDTAAFLAVEHGTSWSDGPSGTYGYIKVQDEVIRWSGKTPDSFTGCTRGALNTRPKSHAVDATTAADQRTKVEEVIYLELPAPMLAYAVLTGVLYGHTGTLPEHWHLGISTSLVRLADFTGIGADVWTPADASKGLILRFSQEKGQDGKAFLEKQVFAPMGCYSPVYADGQVGLRRLAALTGDAAAIMTLTEDHIVSHSGLQHDLSGMMNDFLIEWSFDGKEPRRKTRLFDRRSQRIHGKAPQKVLSWRGLYGSRHTDVTIWQRLQAFYDRYSAPPQRLQVRLLPSFGSIEVGDVARIKVANLRDYAGAGATIDRAFEAQRVSVNHQTGEVDVDFFGSTSRPLTTPPADITAFPLPDAFYSSAGTLLSAVSGVTIASNVLTVAPGTPINGGTDMNAAPAILYWLGDLTIANGVTLKIAGNVWLRVMGALTINGTIDGNYGGLAGVADDGAVEPYLSGNRGFIGNSRGLDGLRVTEMGGNPQLESQPVPTTEGFNAAFPFLQLQVSGNSLQGVPSDLRGTGGGPGGKVVYQSSLRANGGTGGAGGAGLCITARRVDFGASGQITLRGADTAAPSPHLEQGKNFYPGTGGAGGPGSLLITLDAPPSVSVPDLTGKFYGVTGAVALPFYSAEFPILFMPSRAHQRRSRGEQPYAGFLGPEIVSALDLSNACHRIQYIPPAVAPSGDVDEPPAPPLTLGATAGPGYILVSVTPANVPNSVVVLYASVNPNFADAVEIQEIRGTQFYFQLLAEETRYLFVTTRQELDANTIVESEPHPSTTSTVSATAGAFTEANLPEEADFLETFEGQDVADRYDSISGTGTESYPAGTGAFGGRTYQVAGGQRWRVFKRNIPFDPGGRYRVSASVALITAPTNATADRVWFGVAAVAADGVTLLNVVGANDQGSQHYVAAAGADLGSVPLGTYLTFTGYFKGHGTAILTPAPEPDSPSPLYPGTAYFRPLMIVNYPNGDGTMRVDYLRVEKLVNNVWVDILGDGKADDRATMVSSGNLIANGSGEFGDNRNFTAAGFEFVPSGGADSGGPYFRLPPRGGAALISDRSIPVLPSDHEYEFRGALRSPDSGNACYLGLACIDQDGVNITHGRSHCNGPNAYLAADVAAGANSFLVSAHAGDFSAISGDKCIVWDIGVYASDPTFYNKIENYLYVGTGTITKTDLGGGIWRYTLPGGVTVPKSYPNGTLIACNLEGKTYLVPLFDNVVLTSSWDRRSARFRGMNTAYETTDQNSYTFAGQKYYTFRRGTVTVFPILLHNYADGTPRETHIDELQLISYGDQFKKYLYPNVDPYYGAFPAPDPDFVFAEKYMVRFGLEAAWTLSKTGGLVGGIATVNAAGQIITDLWMETPDKEDMIDRIPVRRVRTMKGRSVTVLCRWRRTSSWTTNPAGDSTFLNLQVRTYNAGRTGNTIHGQTSLSSINSRTVNVWQEDSLTVTLTDTINDYYLVGRINFTSSGATLMSAGAIEIDYFDVR